MTFGFNMTVNGSRALAGTAQRLEAVGQCLATFRPMQDQNLKALFLNTLPGLYRYYNPLTATSTRRFLARPSTVSLLATGLASPYHTAATRPESSLKFLIR